MYSYMQKHGPLVERVECLCKDDHRLRKIFIGIRQLNGSDIRVGLLRETVVFLCRAKVPLDLTLHTGLFAVLYSLNSC